MHILFLINSITKTCGISSHVYSLICGLKKYPLIDITVICGYADEEWIQQLNSQHIDIIINHCFDHNKRTYINFSAAALFLFAYCLTNKVDIIHSHHHYCGNIAYYITKVIRIKTFLTNHGIIPPIGRLSHYKTDILIVPTERIKNHIIKCNKIHESKVFIINNGVTRIRSCTTETPKIKIISASRMIKLKALDIYIKAVALLGKEYLEKAEFYLAGEGPEKEKLLELISNSHTQLHYIGNILHFNAELCRYNIYIHTSTLEAFPMTLLEAGMSRTLVIVSNFEGLNEYFSENIDGLVFEMNNVSDLSEKIKFAIDHYEGLRCMRDQYYDKVCRYYTYDRMSQQTVKLYRNIMNV